MIKFTLSSSFFLLFAMPAAFSQKESPASKSAITKFVKYYNTNLPDSIFGLFSPEAKVQLPLQKTSAFLARLQSDFGNIKETSFINYQGSTGTYKVDLQKGIILLNLTVDENKSITGIYAKPYQEEVSEVTKRNISKLQLPFKGEWTVFWGGDTKEQNYHVIAKMQKNAFDLIVTDVNGKSHKTDGKNNEDYYAFGQALLAPCNAEVVFAVEGVKDNQPGVMNAMHTLGNSVLLKTSNQEYILFAHLKQGSVKVKQGDQVKMGQSIGLCGNSGNSSEPHLHFHLQDKEEFGQATGIKSYFDKLAVNGVVKTDYSPVKGEKIKP